MLTLDVRPSKRLIAIYSLLYTLTLGAIIICAKAWPVFISLTILISLLTAGIVAIKQLFYLKMLYWLPQGKIELHFKAFSAVYDKINVRHQGPRLIILSCKNSIQHSHLLLMSDSFSGDDFGALQRVLKQREWDNLQPSSIPHPLLSPPLGRKMTPVS